MAIKYRVSNPDVLNGVLGKNVIAVVAREPEYIGEGDLLVWLRVTHIDGKPVGEKGA